jgi:hypothetical protein
MFDINVFLAGMLAGVAIACIINEKLNGTATRGNDD